MPGTAPPSGKTAIIISRMDYQAAELSRPRSLRSKRKWTQIWELPADYPALAAVQAIAVRL